MSLKTILGSSMFAAGLALAAMPASASPTMGASGVCPITFGHNPAGGGTGNATDCNLFIDFAANGSITTTAGPQTTYDAIEDALIGVYNHTASTIFSFNLSGSNIGGFDGDGINNYVNPPSGSIPNNAMDTTGYGGEFAYFTNNTRNTLTVNFIGGIAAGSTGYFSLEEPASLSLVVTNAPEPASLALLGLGMMGTGLVRRRRRA